MDDSKTISILLVTPSVGFGNLIRQTLEEAGLYKVNQYTNVVGILTGETPNREPLAILDGDLGNLILLKIGERLRQDNPKIRVILVPRGKETPETLAVLQPLGTLNKPFYLPDLIETVEEVLALKSIPMPPHFDTTPHRIAPEPATPPAPLFLNPEEQTQPPPQATDMHAPVVWLRNGDLAAQHLRRLSLTTSAKAALITKDETIWAYTGELPQPIAEQLAGEVHHYWSSYGDSDLARFIRLEETGQEFLLYATAVDNTFVLSLAFDAQTPFSLIRSQTSKVAHALMENLDTGEAAENEKDPAAILPQPFPKQKPSPPKGAQDEQPPRPAVKMNLADEIKASPLPRAPLPYQKVDPAPKPEDPYASRSTHLAETQPTRTIGSDHPSQFDPIVAPPALEPATAAQYNLTYACVLIPRFPEHHLTRDLASKLDLWIFQIAIAFGWRVEHLVIRPGYLQWIVNVEPDTSPDYLMRITRKITSQRIFSHFPIIEEENPSDDFWAPGYLILSGSEMPPPSRLKEFISQTRRRQGLPD